MIFLHIIIRLASHGRLHSHGLSPNLHNIEHVVINSTAQEELALRTGILSVIIPNVLDFENPPRVDSARTQTFRETIGLAPGDVIILQPTRIVQRKGIEHAIELVRELKSNRFKLVISHEAGDEGHDYAHWLKAEARSHGVDLRVVKARIVDPLNGFQGVGGLNPLAPTKNINRLYSS